MNSELQIQLDKILSNLSKVDGVEGSLIVDINGDMLSHHLLQDLDVYLFGPMANVITGSSKRLIDSSNHGGIERIFVESENGKALFLHLGNVHFIVLMESKANVGMIMISSRKASNEIIELTKDLPLEPEEEIIGEVKEVPAEEVKEVVEVETETVEEEPVETTKEPEEIIEVTKEVTEPVEEVQLVIEEEAETVVYTPVGEEVATLEEEVSVEELAPEAGELEAETGELEVQKKVKEELAVEEEPEEEKPLIPVIKPPLTFPKLEKVTEIPDDESERVDLLLEIYEYIFLAMSIGASKIMGVAPARGLTRKFLPVDDYKTLLDGVDVKNNSAIDFDKIRENVEKIPVSEREKTFKESFGKIIEVITENYGKVMGYDAFRGMIRPEFKILNESYGDLLEGLGVKEQLHIELRDFFN